MYEATLRGVSDEASENAQSGSQPRMIRFITFGTPSLERDETVLGGAARQRRVVALLAVLAAARSRGVSRDAVLALLWAETEPEKGRQALAQSLYHVRRTLGEEDLVQTEADLRLNSDVIASDVDEFENALERGELERAVELYRAPFLDGFYVNGAPEFERWAAETRARLQQRCADALEKLATEAESTSDYAVAVRWWRRRAALEPLSSRVTMRLMTALAAAGDRSGAIQQGNVHEALLAQELDLAPEPSFRELMNRLRVDSSWVRASPASDAQKTETVSNASSQLVEPNGARLLPASAPVVGESGLNGIQRVWRSPRAKIMATAVAVLVVGTMLIARAARPRAAPVADMVVVAPFRVSSADPALAYLREGLVDLLVTKLTEDDATPAADAGAVISAWRRAGLADRDVPRADALRLARRLGAHRLLTGSVVGSTSRVVITAALIGIADGSVRAQASVEGHADSLTNLVDGLVARLLAKEAGAWERLANHTSTSSQALRAYLDGRAAYRRGAYETAIRSFRRALDLDPSFAMAGLSLANAADRINDDDERMRGLATAWQAKDELIDRDRIYLEALAGPRYPNRSSAREQLVAWERAAAALPERAQVWHELGERLFNDGRLLAIADWEARAAAAFRRSAALDPSFASPLQFLVQLAAASGDTATVRQTASAYFQLDSVGELAGFVRWRYALSLGDTAQLRRVYRSFSTIPSASLRAIVLTSQLDGIALEDAERALAVLRRRAVRGTDWSDYQLAVHALAQNRGQPRRALRALEELESARSTPEPGLAARLRVLDVLYGAGDSLQAVAAAATLPQGRAGSGLEQEAQCVRGQWESWRAPVELTSEAPRMQKLRRAQSTSQYDVTATSLCDYLVTAIRSVRLRHPEAAQHVSRLDSVVTFGSSLGSLRPYVHLALARLYAQLGESDRAVVTIRRRTNMDDWPHYLAAQRLEEARLLVARGDSRGAESAFKHYLALHSDPEPELRGEVDAIRAELARIGVTQ